MMNRKAEARTQRLRSQIVTLNGGPWFQSPLLKSQSVIPSLEAATDEGNAGS